MSGSGYGCAGDPRSAVVRAVLVRPDLWPAAIGVLWRLAPTRWWRGGTHLPLPDRGLWQFRMVTAYGSPDARPRSRDVISYLEWCRSTTSLRRRAPRGTGHTLRAGRLDRRRSG